MNTMLIHDTQHRAMVSYLESKPAKNATEKSLLEALHGLKSVDGQYEVPDLLAAQVKTLLVSATMVPPKNGNSIDLAGAKAKLLDFESLLILFAAFSRQIRQANHQEAMGSLQNRVSQLKSAAAMREEGAEKMKSQALTSMIIGCVAGAISIVAGAFTTVGALSAMSKMGSAASATGKATESTQKAVESSSKMIEMKEIVSKSAEVSKQVEKASDVIDKTAAAAQKAADTKALTKTAELIAAKWNGLSQVAAAVSSTLNSGAQYAATSGQVQNQLFSANADRMQTTATEFEAIQQNQKDLDQHFGELVRKMTDLIQSMEEAKMKAAEAAAKA